MDQFSWDELWAKSEVVRFIKVMQRVAEAAPTLGWPSASDEAAWREIYSIVFAGKVPHLFSDRHLAGLLNGTARPFIQKKLETGALRRHWQASLSMLPRAMSPAAREASGSKITQFAEGSGPSILSRLLRVVTTQAATV